jgi:hypothetical protein
VLLQPVETLQLAELWAIGCVSDWWAAQLERSTAQGKAAGHC